MIVDSSQLIALENGKYINNMRFWALHSRKKRIFLKVKRSFQLVRNLEKPYNTFFQKSLPHQICKVKFNEIIISQQTNLLQAMFFNNSHFAKINRQKRRLTCLKYYIHIWLKMTRNLFECDLFKLKIHIIII